MSLESFLVVMVMVEPTLEVDFALVSPDHVPLHVQYLQQKSFTDFDARPTIVVSAAAAFVNINRFG